MTVTLRGRRAVTVKVTANYRQIAIGGAGFYGTIKKPEPFI
jgi:hypothetical protein